MAVASNFNRWTQLLTVASEEARQEAMRLTSEMNGPFSQAGRLSRSVEFWEGPFAEHLRQFMRMIDSFLAATAFDLSRFSSRMETAAAEAQGAANAEALGLPIPQADPQGAVSEWRRWPAAPTPAWGRPPSGGTPSGYVSIYLDRAREFGRLLAVGAGEVGGSQRRLAGVFAPLGLEAPPVLELLARAAEEASGEVERRVRALEEADRQAAGAFAVAPGLFRVPAGLAAHLAFDPADAVGSVVRELAQSAPGLDLGPGNQPAQAKEADPVSVSTGNFCYEATDLAMSGRGLPTVFTRTYNSSRAGIDGPLGFGWSHNFGLRLLVEDDAAVVCLGDGREERHRLREGASPLPPPGAAGRVDVVAGTFVFTTEDGVVRRFDAAGRLARLADRSGNETVLDRDANGRLLRVRDAAGRVTSFEHDDQGRIRALRDCLGGLFRYGYDARGDLVEVTNAAGATWRYAYDEMHRLVRIVDPEGNVVVSNGYDDAGRVVEQLDGAGHRWRYAYQPGLTVVTDPLLESVVYEHDARFRAIALADALGAKTRFDWDSQDRLVAVVNPAGGRVALGYDERGNLTQVDSPGEAPVRFAWDENDNLAAVEGAEGHRALFTYDDASRPLTLTRPGGTQTRIGWRADGLPEIVVEGDGGATRFAYDDAGYPAEITDPLGATTKVTFDAAGRPLSEVHPGGARTEFTWDPMGRLLAVTDACAGTTAFGYDRTGRLVSVTDPLGRTSRFAYEERGLLASVTDPLGRTTTFDYDPCGRLIARTDASGAPVRFSYDPVGRLVGIEAAGIDPVTYEWDAVGRLVSLTDATGTTTFEYDSAGRPIAERHDRAGTELLHGYDTLGRRRQLELRRSGETLAVWQHDYDPDGRVARVVDPTGKEARLNYDPAGRLGRVHHANGVVDHWAYDPAGQPATLTVHTPGGGVTSAWAFSYDTDGNRTRATRTCAGAVTDSAYAYDALGRSSLPSPLAARRSASSGTRRATALQPAAR